MAEIFLTRVFGILASGIDTVATSVLLTAGHGARFGTIPGGDFIRGSLINSSGQIEDVQITARSTDTLTIVRNYDGSTALSFVAGDRIEARIGKSSMSGIAQVAHLQTNEKKFGVNTGTVDALIVTLPSSSINALVRGMEVDVELTGANTGGPASLKVVLGTTDTGLLPIVKNASGSAGVAIAAGNLPGANAHVKFQYNPDLASWVLLNPAEVAIPQNSQSANYTTVLGDAGKHLLHPASDNNARTFTIDSNANVPHVLGTLLTFVNKVNVLTLAITADTLTQAGTGSTGSRALAANGVANALKIGTTEWLIWGTGLS